MDELKLYTYRVVLERVVDGDTIDVQVDLGFSVWVRNRLRLAGINTPEVRTGPKEERAQGRWVSDLVQEMLMTSTEIRIQSLGVGKYGRALAVVWLRRANAEGVEEWLNLNRWLLRNGHAREYPGGPVW